MAGLANQRGKKYCVWFEGRRIGLEATRGGLRRAHAVQSWHMAVECMSPWVMASAHGTQAEDARGLAAQTTMSTTHDARAALQPTSNWPCLHGRLSKRACASPA